MSRLRWTTAVAAVLMVGAGTVSPAGAGVTPPPETFNEFFQSIPIAANGTYTPLVGGLDCQDEGGDFGIVWYAPGTAKDFTWVDFQEGATEAEVDYTSEGLTINGVYEPVVGDFDDDGCDDIFWYAPGAAADFVWYGDPAGYVSTPVAASFDLTPVVGDFDDGTPGDDIFWYGEGGGTEAIWSGTATRGTFTPGTAPQVAGTDFTIVSTGSGLFFYRPGAGADYIWDGVIAGASAPGASVATVVNRTYEPYFVEGILLYGPGPAVDKLAADYNPETGELETVDGTINGTYRVGVTPPTQFPVIVFHAPGAAQDYLWVPSLMTAGSGAFAADAPAARPW